MARIGSNERAISPKSRAVLSAYSKRPRRNLSRPNMPTAQPHNLLQLSKNLRKQSAVSRQTYVSKSGQNLFNHSFNPNFQRGKSAKIRGGVTKSNTLMYQSSELSGANGQQQRNNFVHQYD